MCLISMDNFGLREMACMGLRLDGQLLNLNDCNVETW
jgi:hypothetical protein